MLKIIVIGDLHFKQNNKNETDEFHQELLKVIKSQHFDFAVFLGDILDRHDVVNLGPYNRSINLFEDVCQYCPLYILIGNHDRSNNSDFLSTNHIFNPLKKWDNITIVDHVIKKTINNIPIILLPYVPNGRFMEALQTVDFDPNVNSIIFCHQEFSGCKINKILSVNGDVWNNKSLIISGHIHQYHHVNHNIIYVGSAIQANFGEEDEKTISIFTIDDNIFNGMNDNIHDAVVEERIKLNITRKITIHLTIQQLQQWKCPENQVIRLIITGTCPEIQALSKSHLMKELEKKRIKIVYNFENTEDVKQINNVGINNPVNNQNYYQRLEEVVKLDEQQLKWFKKLISIS